MVALLSEFVTNFQKEDLESVIMRTGKQYFGWTEEDAEEIISKRNLESSDEEKQEMSDDGLLPSPQNHRSQRLAASSIKERPKRRPSGDEHSSLVFKNKRFDQNAKAPYNLAQFGKRRSRSLTEMDIEKIMRPKGLYVSYHHFLACLKELKKISDKLEKKKRWLIDM